MLIDMAVERQRPLFPTLIYSTTVAAAFLVPVATEGASDHNSSSITTPDTPIVTTPGTDNHSNADIHINPATTTVGNPSTGGVLIADPQMQHHNSLSQYHPLMSEHPSSSFIFGPFYFSTL
ncbi:unnamed protein product [Protopolystoma xenopodis]|uniref:Uncharacterized protein n=1 Tax=Protopolystoma xenopodis TaxID=117903 RepID=A0A448WMN3_9PLAT|nr:unnamed protein product [Protopolystoma xenopodis]